MGHYNVAVPSDVSHYRFYVSIFNSHGCVNAVKMVSSLLTMEELKLIFCIVCIIPHPQPIGL